jgi:hypothetical protein
VAAAQLTVCPCQAALCALLCCAVLCCAVLCCAVLCCAVLLCCAVQEWLCTEGSPHSHIERCDFKKERNIQQLEYQVFERRPNVP